ncbi:MAG: helicase C-terminal domain-containing protein [Patescibacteria group bacterium]
MKHPKHLDLWSCFPHDCYPNILDNQRDALRVIEQEGGCALLQLPTGSGKTAVGYAFLKAVLKRAEGPVYYVVPTKTLVEQVRRLHPDVKIIFGRNEYSCLFYPDQELKADEVPCSMLHDCPHRVDQETGQTAVPGVKPCPYLQKKWEASQGGIVVCTTAFFLFTHLFASEDAKPAALVIDEAHGIAHTVRGCLSYEITDYHLGRAVELLRPVDNEQAERLDAFLRTMVRIIKKKASGERQIIEDEEVAKLLDKLKQINITRLGEKVRQAIRQGVIDAKAERETLRRLEIVLRDLSHYARSLEYSRPNEKRNALNYTYAFWSQERAEGERVKYRLFIKCYYVAPLIRRMLPEMTVAYSATIGDPEVFGFETGIEAPFHSFGSDFPVGKTQIFVPTDTPNLAVNVRGRQDRTRALRRIAKACRRFADQGRRSLVVVISNEERAKFLTLAGEEGVAAVSYGNGVKPKDAALKFKEGEGDVLVGTAANYGEGFDLPKGIAPVIFFLRPGFPHPHDPATVFEERRFGGMRWRIWNWRVMMEALQVRGRNIRSAEDVGVCFFISQQFRRFVFAALPDWLQPAYCGDKDWEECLEEAERLLS